MRESKATLITIIVLLIVFLPATIYGALNKPSNKKGNNIDDNPNHEFKLNNKLYYYDEDNNLLGKYNCQNEKCGNINTIINDEEYGIDYYKEGIKEELSSYDSEYAFLQDGESIKLYSFANEKEIFSFNNFKDYHTELHNSYVIAQKDNLWGVLSLNSKTPVIPFSYEFIGLKNNIIDDELDTSVFIVLKDNKWYLITDTNEEITAGLDLPIKSYTENYLIANDNSIYSYDGIEVSNSNRFKEVYAIDNYIVGITSSNLAIVYLNPAESNIGHINLGDYKDLKIVFNNGVLEFYDTGIMLQSIALS